jgi:hypothetical protein
MPPSTSGAHACRVDLLDVVIGVQSVPAVLGGHARRPLAVLQQRPMRKLAQPHTPQQSRKHLYKQKGRPVGPDRTGLPAHLHGVGVERGMDACNRAARVAQRRELPQEEWELAICPSRHADPLYYTETPAPVAMSVALPAAGDPDDLSTAKEPSCG